MMSEHSVYVQYKLPIKAISQHAIEVIKKLTAEGYEAYLVGGCVRDLLLNVQPKDFDVATNALPEQVHQLFSNSRLIGRRFKLVHVGYGANTIEVATYRAPPEQTKNTHPTGRIIQDNQFGSIEQDARRRDFTINALFYDIHQMTIIDYTAGMTDLNDRVVRIIGEANTRYREDPVRILRAIRFKAKLGLAIEEKTASLIAPLAHLLTAIPAARLFDEVLKLYLTGHARSSHQLLVDYQVLDYLFPATVTALTARQETTDRLLIERALYNTDQRITARKPVTPAFLYAVLLWPVLKQKWVEYQTQHPLAVAMQKAAIEVIGQQYKTTAIPKRFAIIVRDIWQLQIKLEQRHGKRAWRTLSHPKFRAGYDFLLLRVEAGEPLAELAQWWTDFQFASSEQQQQQVAAIKPTTQRYRRRQRKKRH